MSLLLPSLRAPIVQRVSPQHTTCHLEAGPIAHKEPHEGQGTRRAPEMESCSSSDEEGPQELTEAPLASLGPRGTFWARGHHHSAGQQGDVEAQTPGHAEERAPARLSLYTGLGGNATAKGQGEPPNGP